MANQTINCSNLLRSLLAAFAVVVLLPAMAEAWYVNAKTSPLSGQGTISPAGNTYITGAAGTSFTCSVDPAPGYMVSRVTLDGVVMSPTSTVVEGENTIYTYTVPYNGKTWRYVIAYFVVAPSGYTISTNSGTNGTIREIASLPLAGIPAGSSRTLLVSPNTGYLTDTVTASNATPIDNGDGTWTVAYTNIQANQSVTATFVVAQVSANAGPDVYTPGNGESYTATLNGSQSTSSVGAITYEWSGPGLEFGSPTMAVTTVYSNMDGTYTATLTVTAGGISASDTASVTIPTRAAYLEGFCTSCHTTRNPTVVAAYDSSKHRQTGGTLPVAACQSCHDPLDSKHYTIHRPTGSCQPCHANVPGSSHATLELADRCVGCHNPHSTAASCHGCHGNSTAGTIWPDGIVENPEYAWADDAGSHQKHVVFLGTGNLSCMTCHPGNPPVGHFVDQASGAQQAEVIRMDGNGDGVPDFWRFAEGATAGSGTAVYIQTRTGADQNAWFSLADRSCNQLDCHSDGNFDSDPAAGGRGPIPRSPVWGTALDCTGCHGEGTQAYPSYPNGGPGGDSNSHEIHLAGGAIVCNDCHSGTGTHVNMTVEVSGSRIAAYNAGSETCSSVQCHGGTDAQWGGGACIGCHSVTQGARAAITGQFAANSHHVQGPAVSNGHCYQCHWEAKSDGTINAAYHTKTSSAPVDLVIYGAGSRPTTYSATTAVAYRADGTRGEITKLDSHCLGCHSDANNASTPFGDGNTPKQYAWDGTSIGSRYSQTGTTPWGKYTGTNISPKAARVKALSAHGNAVANEGGWNLSETWPNTRAGGVNVACYDCHNSHGSSVEGRTTSYASGTLSGGLLKTTAAGRGGYQVDYQPLPAGSIEAKNLRNPGASLCVDCHMVADGGATQPWGYQATFGATQQIIGYYDGPWNGIGAAGTVQRYSYKGILNTAGGHFGASSPLRSPAVKGIDGLCTPCHDPHGVSPSLGANQANGIPLLKGSWLTSPYKEDVAPSYNTTQTNYDTFRIDENTFGTSIYTLVTGITQTDAQFAGLCLQCHPKERLTDGVTHTWKGKDRVHESVKGWKTAVTPVKHKYSCSKCHSPHFGSALPRLMVSDCLDPAHKGRIGGNPNPVVIGYDDWGSLMGRIPNANCHESPNGYRNSGTDQSWNQVTPWYVETPLAITTGPSAGSFVISGTLRATISWNTNLESTSYVDYGLTNAYGSTTGNTSLVVSHNVQLQSLSNHTTYHYRVRSTSLKGQETVSPDGTFYISLPPTVPAIVNEPDAFCAGTCPVTLVWNASTDPIDGGPIQYYVEVSTASNFSTGLVASGWLSTTNWTIDLNTSATYYWRVKSRDGNHFTPQDPVSAWSGTDSFKIMTALPPTAPVIVPHGNYDSGCADTLVTVQWNPVTSPDGHPVEYFVQTDSVVPSGWLPAGTTNWSFTLPAGWGITWQVMARDAGHPDATSAFSTSEYFYDYGSGCWSSSCPLVFAWTGSQYDYITDLAGPIIGLNPTLSSREVTLFQPEVAILNGLTPDGDGNFRIRIRESLPEVSYLDSAQLLVVDAPAGYEVHTSGAETTYIYGYANPLRFYTAKDPQPPLSAVDSYGNDVLASVLEVDNVSASLAPFDTDFYYTVDFGSLQRPQFAKLLIDGWTLYGVKRLTADTLIQPYVEVVDGEGNWVKVKSFGTPAGDLKTMVVDLSNLFLSNDHRVRIHTGMRRSSRWVIDRIRLDQSVPVSYSVQELPVASAELQYGGNAIQSISTLSSRISASDVDLPVDWRSPSYGSFTRYGDVTPLFAAQDDRYAILRQGDRVDLVFPAAGPLQEGFARTLIIRSSLYYKSLVVSDTVDPLPFRGMSDYPYPETESYPTDAEHQQYLQEYNTRVVAPAP